MVKDWDPQRIKKLTAVINAIPAGKVASYGQIASLAGLPRGHRTVARFLKYCEPDLGLTLPWYRVMRNDGKLGMEPHSGAYKLQRDLLKTEGVLMKSGKVDMKSFQWQPDLDFFLFHPDL